MKNIIIKLFQERKISKNNKGQTSYYFLVLISISTISFAAMFNIAQLIRDRMTMQNKADNMAVSLATYKARVLNFLGETNYFIGLILHLGISSQQKKFLSDLKQDYLEREQDDCMKKTRKYEEKLINKLQAIQEKAIKDYLSYYCGVVSNKVSESYDVFIYPENPDLNLGLKRSSNGINCTYSNQRLRFLKKSKYSWFVEGNKFNRQKIKVVLRQKSKTWNPLFAKLLGIRYAQIVVYSAASPYNVKGSMFPKNDNTLIDIPKTAQQTNLETINSNNKDTPINAYLNAKAGGWAAHLVPYDN